MLVMPFVLNVELKFKLLPKLNQKLLRFNQRQCN